MSGEIITAETLIDAKEELRNIYKAKSNQFKEISKTQYEEIEKSEREDSDNHLNLERLKKGESKVIDLAYYKYLEDRQVAYKIILRESNGDEMEDYFTLIPDLA
jgi:hypothetical protein